MNELALVSVTHPPYSVLSYPRLQYQGSDKSLVTVWGACVHGDNLRTTKGWDEFPAADDPQFPLDFTGMELLPAQQDAIEIPIEALTPRLGLIDIAKQFLFRAPILSTARLPLLAPAIRDIAGERGLPFIRASAKRLSDPNYLRNITLNELGFAITVAIHGPLHMRMSMQPYQKAQWQNRAVRPQLTFEEVIGVDNNRTYNPAWVYNDPRYYDYMFDSYANMNAPSFWKLHGWIQTALERWLVANSYNRASQDCRGETKCYQWTNTFALRAVRDEVAKQVRVCGIQPCTEGFAALVHWYPKLDTGANMAYFHEPPIEVSRSSDLCTTSLIDTEFGNLLKFYKVLHIDGIPCWGLF